MTEQEAEVLAARLTRIWKPIMPCQFKIYRCSPEWGVVTDEFGFAFEYSALLSENIEFEYRIDTVLRAKHRFTIGITRTEQGEKTGFLGYHGYLHEFLHNGRNEEKSYQEFSDHWMPFFRCGLWLSHRSHCS
jgi:hypothetical protein